MVTQRLSKASGGSFIRNAHCPTAIYEATRLLECEVA